MTIDNRPGLIQFGRWPRLFLECKGRHYHKASYGRQLAGWSMAVPGIFVLIFGSPGLHGRRSRDFEVELTCQFGNREVYQLKMLLVH